MSAPRLRFADKNVCGGVELGAVTQVYTHRGLDNAQQVVVRFEKTCSRLEMPRSAAERLMRELTLALATNCSQGDVSGSRWKGSE